MRRFRGLLQASVAVLALGLTLSAAGPAAAAGPYEPFPEDPRQRAVDTVEQLNDRLLPSTAPSLDIPQLEAGIVLRTERKPPRRDRDESQLVSAEPSSTPTSGTADALFRRAGVDSPTDGSTLAGWWLLALAGMLALAAAAFELRAVRLNQSP